MGKLDGSVRRPGDESSTEEGKASTVVEASGCAQTFDRVRGVEARGIEANRAKQKLVSEKVANPEAFDGVVE